MPPAAVGAGAGQQQGWWSSLLDGLGSMLQLQEESADEEDEALLGIGGMEGVAVRRWGDAQQQPTCCALCGQGADGGPVAWRCACSACLHAGCLALHAPRGCPACGSAIPAAALAAAADAADADDDLGASPFGGFVTGAALASGLGQGDEGSMGVADPSQAQLHAGSAGAVSSRISILVEDTGQTHTLTLDSRDLSDLPTKLRSLLAVKDSADFDFDLPLGGGEKVHLGGIGALQTYCAAHMRTLAATSSMAAASSMWDPPVGHGGQATGGNSPCSSNGSLGGALLKHSSCMGALGPSIAAAVREQQQHAGRAEGRLHAARTSPHGGHGGRGGTPRHDSASAAAASLRLQRMLSAPCRLPTQRPSKRDVATCQPNPQDCLFALG